MKTDSSVFQDKRKLSLIVVLAIVLAALLAFGGYQIVASAQSKPETRVDAVELSVAEPMSVQFIGIPAETLCGPYVTAVADSGDIVIEKSEMHDAVTLDLGTYTVSVVAPAVANDGTIYVTAEPTKTVSVKPSATPELSFEFTELDPADTEAVNKAKDELAQVGVPEDVTSAIESKYPNTADPADGGSDANTALDSSGATTSNGASSTANTGSDNPDSNPGNSGNTGSSGNTGNTQTATAPAQSHTHNWIPKTVTVPGGQITKYRAYIICTGNNGANANACGYTITSDEIMDSKRNPSDYGEMYEWLHRHQAETGHTTSDYGYEPLATGFQDSHTETTYTCSGCGATK